MNKRILALKKSEALHHRIKALAISLILFSQLIAGNGLAQQGNDHTVSFIINKLLAQSAPPQDPNATASAAKPPQQTKKPKKKDDGSRSCLDCDPGGGGGGGGTNTPPVAITGGPYYGEAGQTIQPYGGNSYDPDGSLTSYQWSFGDGTTATGVSPTHNYGADGTYTVSLTVTDNSGATNTSLSTVNVNANPQPVTINFDNLPLNTLVSNQYSQVTFSSENLYFNPPFTSSNCGYCVTASSPHFVTSGIGYGNGNHELILDFKQPVRDVTFYAVGGDNFGIIANIDIWENGNLARTIYLQGAGYAYYPIFADLKPYGSNITKIRIYNIVDTNGLGFDDFTFTPVGKVESVSLEQVDSFLDTNPNAGGGLAPNDNKRIFPDKQFPADTVNRRRVRVRANTSLGPNKTVYFRAYDVDDPSTDAAPVDANSTAGNDNRGAPATAYNGLSAPSAQTDSNGVATVEFNTTMQPGDNFRVVASADSNYLNGLFATGVNIKDASGATLPTDKAKPSPMLTVWRNLHLEVDSMGAVTGNLLSGSVTQTKKQDVVTHCGPNDLCLKTETFICVNQPMEVNRFMGGNIEIGFGRYRVDYNDANCASIGYDQTINPAPGTTFTLYDDDDFNDNDGSILDGDSFENVVRPDTSLMQPSDNPALNVFAPAYVRPLYDLGDNNDFVPFVLNTPSEEAARVQTYDFDNIGTENDRNFWTVYLLGSYQYATESDADPNSEPPVLATVDYIPSIDLRGGLGACIFNEILRPKETVINFTSNRAAAAAHEIGHLFDGRHEDYINNDAGLMAQAQIRTTLNFNAVTLNKIRNAANP